MDISYDTLKAGAKLFGVDMDTLGLLGGMDGTAYAYTQAGRQYVLKFAPVPGERVPGLQAKLDFVSYLGTNGVSVAKPVASVNTRLVETLPFPGPRGQVYAVTASERARGKNAFEAGEWNDELFEQWGRIIGQMHRLTKTYDEQRAWPDGLIGDWEGEHYSFAQTCEDDAVRAKWFALADALRQFTPDRDCYGLIHNDPHPFNFTVSREQGALRLTLFDFDVCAYHWFMTDIGIALFHALWAQRADGRSAEAFAARFMDRFLRGYEPENRLDSAWLKRLPMFVKYRQMLLYMVFSHEWEQPNEGQARQLREWRDAIVNDFPVVNMN
ncbi:MAG: phosphotransferase [Chloroflexi bacterium]|nr:phosphotransferase [Chloroflexota bacterium]MCL5273190.1 phosphotransferase [Chloroflexota bacterium]